MTLPISAPLNKLVKWNKEKTNELINAVSSGLCFFPFNKSPITIMAMPLKINSSNKATPIT